MRAGVIVVADVLGKDVVQVTLVQHDELVKAFFADRTDPALGKGIGFGCAHRCFEDVDAFGFEDGVEDRRVLAIAIVIASSVPDKSSPQAATGSSLPCRVRKLYPFSRVHDQERTSSGKIALLIPVRCENPIQGRNPSGSQYV